MSVHAHNMRLEQIYIYRYSSNVKNETITYTNTLITRTRLHYVPRSIVLMFALWHD